MNDQSKLWFGVISLFPKMFQALEFGITGRAIKEQVLNLHLSNPRDFAEDKRKTVDDYPYGGGSGMVMKVEPLQAAIHAARAAAPQKPLVIYLSPQGKPFNQERAKQLLHQQSMILIAGRYEGIDERIITHEVDDEWSIGDYILTGGELAAMVIIDAVARLAPGVVGDKNSVSEDSITSGLLKYPQFTRPECIEGQKIPAVLLSGNHQQITKWRLQQSLGKTWLKRPDLLTRKELTPEEMALLNDFIQRFVEEKGCK